MSARKNDLSKFALERVSRTPDGYQMRWRVRHIPTGRFNWVPGVSGKPSPAYFRTLCNTLKAAL